MCDLKKITYPKTLDYKSGTPYEPILFFLDAFSESKNLDLLLGYFSSTALSVLSLGITKFLVNGGMMRVVINNVLSLADKEVLIASHENISLNPDLSFDKILSLLDEPGKHTLECFAWLLQNNRIEIVAVRPKSGRGISHYKSGVFFDGNQKISFKGSCNFSAQALLENLEELNVRRSWDLESDKLAISETESYFEDIFNGVSDNVERIPYSDIEARIIGEFGGKELHELVSQESILLKKKAEQISRNSKLRKSLEKLEGDLFKILTSPKFPYKEGARSYQKQAYLNWIENGSKGIFAMATGTGKTITSLNCVLEEFKKSGSYNAIIVVPTIPLVEQWEEECCKFNFNNIVKVASGQKWESSLVNHFAKVSLSSFSSLIIIITYSSFIRKKFAQYFPMFKSSDILIADEAHNMGSKSVLKMLPKITHQKRIGLSATIERQYDDFGNAQLREFFNSESPYTFNYSMKEAIDSEALCKYYYYPHVVHLNEIELQEYEKISKQLAKFFNAETGAYSKNEIVEILLLKRKRIIHKAQGKLKVFKKVLRQEFEKRGQLVNTLVYVPEGDIDQELHNEPEFHNNLLNEFTKAVRDVDRWLTVAQYTSNTINRKELLNKFKNREINILTSMKCLDEGVDIPQTELAFFCASTGNPKQFIQRRGRVLRQYPGKNFAVIHDLIVVPNMIADHDSAYKMQQSIVRKELERVVNFSFLAINKYHTFNTLDEICRHYKLNLFTINEHINNDN